MWQAHAGDDIQIVLNSTPFYAEGGGQIGDSGTLKSVVPHGSGAEPEPALIRVTDVQKAAGGSLFVHTGHLEAGILYTGQQVLAAFSHVASFLLSHLWTASRFVG